MDAPYCYARPSSRLRRLSPGLDFETKLFYKADAAAVLEKELAAPSYKCAPIMIGANTDPYQPLGKSLKVTRSLLEVLLAPQASREHHHQRRAGGARRRSARRARRATDSRG